MSQDMSPTNPLPFIVSVPHLHYFSLMACICALVSFEEMLIFSLISEELKDYLFGDRAINKIFTLGKSEFPVSWENEIKLWTFLETRAALLLKTYKTTSQVSQLQFNFH